MIDAYGMEGMEMTTNTLSGITHLFPFVLHIYIYLGGMEITKNTAMSEMLALKLCRGVEEE